MSDKSDKAGRNEAKCKAYRNAATQDCNRLRRLIRHAKRMTKFGFGKKGIFNPAIYGKDFAAAFARCNAALPNFRIKQICQELHVTLA